MILSLMASASASEADKEYHQTATFGQWAGSLIQDIGGYSFGKACPNSDDGYHHSKSSLGQRVDPISGETPYYNCICDYCGGNFVAYETDVKQSYDAQVSELPAPEITSAGYLLWQPSYSNVSELRRYTTSNGSFTETWFEKPFYSEIPITPASNGFSFSFVPSELSIGSAYLCVGVYFYDFPISGTYSVFENGICFSRYIRSTGDILEQSSSHSGGSGHLRPDSTLFWACELSNKISSTYTYIFASIVFPTYKIIPDSAVDFGSTGSTYNITTRPTSISGGNYGIVGDDGKITTNNDNRTIVNETTNQYYNPSTGETYPIENWSYDYSTRTYTLNVNTGDTTGDTTNNKNITVTYGDENITINEYNSTTGDTSGDTVTNTYTIYYIVQGSGSGDSHTHDWRESSVIEASCLQPGKTIYTCASCGDTKWETSPALGHSWRILRTVTNQYDENGTLIQEGYILYECERCGEQYRTTDTSVRPSPGDPGNTGGTTTPGNPDGDDKETIWDKLGNLLGTIGEGILGLIEAVAGKLLDALISLAEMINEKLKSVVETVLSLLDVLPTLFGGFLDFLGALFPYLPSELTMLLTFGVVVIVFIGIIKAVRR